MHALLERIRSGLSDANGCLANATRHERATLELLEALVESSERHEFGLWFLQPDREDDE